MHRAKGPSKIQPDGPKAESHGAATSVQKRRSVTSCPEHDTWASHSALLKVAWSPAGIGAGSCSECKSSPFMTSVDRKVFWRAECPLTQAEWAH